MNILATIICLPGEVMEIHIFNPGLGIKPLLLPRPLVILGANKLPRHPFKRALYLAKNRR